MVASYSFDDAMTESAGGNPAFAPSAGAVASTFGAGRFGKALYLTSGAQVTATIKAPPAQWTTSHWVRQTARTVDDLGTAGNGCALTYGNDAVISAKEFDWVGAYSKGGSKTTCSVTPSVSMMVLGVTVKNPIDQWTHLATVFDGTVGHIYQDGVKVSTSGTYNFNTAIPRIWSLGATVSANEKNTFVGAIDELKIFGVALTPQQVANLYNGNDVNFGDELCAGGTKPLAPTVR